MATSTTRDSTSSKPDGPGIPLRWISRIAWATLIWHIVTILAGTVVRATGSGDGCGSHWPLCNGEVLPVAPSIKTIIEFTHRRISAFDGVLVLLDGLLTKKLRFEASVPGGLIFPFGPGGLNQGKGAENQERCFVS